MINSCEQYHEESSYDRHGMSGHLLDWANQPSVFKVYQGIDPLEMPREVGLPKSHVSSLLLEQDGTKGSVDEIGDLSRILLLTNTLTARARHPDGDFYYRSAASAGALYPTEVYVATRGINGLEDGLYHFAIHLHGLHPLRQGDFGSHVLEMTRMQGEGIPRLTFFLTAIFFRSAWKYRARAYRYHLLDTGHVLENLILALRAQDLPADLSYDFDDQGVNRFLGIDEKREVALAVVHVFGSEEAHRTRVEAEVLESPREILQASIVSAKEVEYPVIGEMHQVSSQIIELEVPGTSMAREIGPQVEDWTKIRGLPAWPEKLAYTEALFQRRSKRNFVERAIAAGQMSAFLEALCAGEDRDGRAPYETYESVLAIGILVNKVDGLAQGFYLLDRPSRTIGMVAASSFTEKMARICLDQMWVANAGVLFLFLVNLDVLSRTWGPRGYRYAMLSAGRLGQKLYIASTAMELGCCGIGAFYDGEAVELLGLNDRSRLLYLVAVGAVKRL
ncbi:MAG: SagB/ThcOx family dehydrogenase [Deltaproteobacteria bacterium]|nr:SagB/ThcOx family dehydrogenase [Deltaproteobacteria bacterium]